MDATAMELHRLEVRIPGYDARQSSVFGVGIAFIAVSLVVLAVRLHVRFFIVHRLGLDDVFMLLGTIFAFGLSAASMAAAHYGVGMWISQIPKDNYTPMLQAIYSTRLFYVVAMLFVKLSLLVFYLRLDQRRTMRWTVYTLMFCVTSFSIASFFVLALSCSPPAAFWDTSGIVQGKCIDVVSQQQLYDANGILNIIYDVAIYLTPMPTLWKIQMPLRSKIAMSFVLGMGFISVAAGCARFAYVRLLSGEEEIYYYLVESLNWCSVEIYLAIFCGSASAFRKFSGTYFPRFFSSQPRNDSSNNEIIPSGQFALNTFGGTPMELRDNGYDQHSTHTTSNRGDGFAQLHRNNSEDAIISGG